MKSEADSPTVSPTPTEPDLRHDSGPMSVMTIFRQVPRLTARFVNDVERCLGGAPETTEPRLGDHFSDAGFSGLRAQTQSYFLRS